MQGRYLNRRCFYGREARGYEQARYNPSCLCARLRIVPEGAGNCGRGLCPWSIWLCQERHVDHFPESPREWEGACVKLPVPEAQQTYYG